MTSIDEEDEDAGTDPVQIAIVDVSGGGRISVSRRTLMVDVSGVRFGYWSSPCWSGTSVLQYVRRGGYSYGTQVGELTRV